MRISDWSSDVCSPDLLIMMCVPYYFVMGSSTRRRSKAEQARGVIHQHLPALDRVGKQGVQKGQLRVVAGARLELGMGPVAAPDKTIDTATRLAQLRQQIGNTSCRDRVGPYV